MFDKPTDPELVSAKVARDWPDARGMFQNLDRNVMVWVNEVEHIRLIAMESGGDVHHVFELFCTALEKFEIQLKALDWKFAWDDHLGFVVANLSDIG